MRFLYESELYEITIKDVKLFPQGCSALALHPEYLKNEQSVLLVDIGGWTVDLYEAGQCCSQCSNVQESGAWSLTDGASINLVPVK